MLSNKFILSESTGDEYMEHVVLPTDTLQGLCLAYKLSATRLRMINGFSGNSLQMAPKKLRIPTPTKSSGIMIRTQGELYNALARHAAPM
jgi:LysM repeat protein